MEDLKVFLNDSFVKFVALINLEKEEKYKFFMKTLFSSIMP